MNTYTKITFNNIYLLLIATVTSTILSHMLKIVCIRNKVWNLTSFCEICNKRNRKVLSYNFYHDIINNLKIKTMFYWKLESNVHSCTYMNIKVCAIKSFSKLELTVNFVPNIYNLKLSWNTYLFVRHPAWQRWWHYQKNHSYYWIECPQLCNQVLQKFVHI